MVLFFFLFPPSMDATGCMAGYGVQLERGSGHYMCRSVFSQATTSLRMSHTGSRWYSVEWSPLTSLDSCASNLARLEPEQFSSEEKDKRA